MRNLKTWSSAIAIVLLLAIGTLGQDAKPEEKKRRSRESAVRRALERAAAADSEHVERVTAVPSSALDEPSYIVFVEFTSGLFAVFQGGAESEADAWVLVEKRHLGALEECAHRSGRVLR